MALQLTEEEITKLQTLLGSPIQDVMQFTAQDVKGLDTVTVYLGPEVALVKTATWPRDEAGKPTGIGTMQTVTLHRHTLIGLAYEILRSVDINRIV